MIVRGIYLYFLHPAHQLLFPVETPYRGAMALEFFRGGILSWLDFRPDDYAGGSFVISFIIALIFKVLGTNLLALKLAALLVSAGTLLCWETVILKGLGRKQTILFSLFFIFASPNFFDYTLTPLGDHTESMFFTVFTILLLMGIMTAPKPKKRDFILLGFTVGFATWFAYIYALTIMAATLWVWVSKKTELFARNIYWLIPSIFVGFMPWVFMKLFLPSYGTNIQGAYFWEHFSFTQLKYFFLPLGQSALFSLASSFGNSRDGAIFSFIRVNHYYTILYFLPIAAGVFMNHKRLFRRIEGNQPNLFLFCVIYFLIAILLVQFSYFRGARYLMPLHPILFLMLSTVLVHDKFVKPAFIALTALLVWGFVNFSVARFSFQYAGSALRCSGYSYSWFAQSPICSDFSAGIQSLKKFFKRLNAWDQHQMRVHVTERFVSELTSDQLSNQAKRLEMLLDLSMQDYYAFYLGNAVWMEIEQGNRGFDSWFHDVCKHYSSYLPQIYLGLLRGFSESEIINRNLEESLKNNLPHDWSWRFYYSKGQRMFRMMLQESGNDDEALRRFFKSLMEEAQDNQGALVQGAGFAFYSQWGYHPTREIWVPEMPYVSKNFHKDFYVGMGRGLMWDKILTPLPDLRWIEKLLNRGIHRDDLPYIREGEYSELLFFKKLNLGIDFADDHAI